jgi:hypothetical protein
VQTTLHATLKTSTTLSGTGIGANLLPAAAPTTGAGVAWNSGTGTATATAANDIVRWNNSLTPGKGYQVTFNYTMTSGSKIRITNGLSNGSLIVATSAVLGASGSVTLFFISTGDNLAFEADTLAFTGTISSIVLQDAPALVATSTAAGGVRTTRPLSGLSYFSGVITTLTGTPQIGIAQTNWDNTTALGTGTNTVGYQPSGAVRNNNATLATIGTYVQGDRIDVAINAADRLIWFRVNNGNWNNNVANDPATNTGGIDYSSITGLGTMMAAISASLTGNVWTMQFSTPFTNAAPTGYVSIDTQSYVRADTVNFQNNVPLGVPASYGLKATNMPREHCMTSRVFMGTAITTVSGVIRELGTPVAGRKVEVYDRLTGELLGSTVSAGDGSYSIPCLGRPSVRIVASDPTTYNSLALDNVSPA